MSTTKFRTLIPMFEELRGERVIIRPYRESDAQDVFEAVGEWRDHLRPWLPFADEHQTVEETRDWIIHQVAAWLLREDMTLGMWGPRPIATSVGPDFTQANGILGNLKSGNG